MPVPALLSLQSKSHGGYANGVAATPLQQLNDPPLHTHKIHLLVTPAPPPLPALEDTSHIPTPPAPPSVPAQLIKLGNSDCCSRSEQQT